MADSPKCPHCGREYDDTATTHERDRLKEHMSRDWNSASRDAINPPETPDKNRYDPDEITSERMNPNRAEDISYGRIVTPRSFLRSI